MKIALIALLPFFLGACARPVDGGATQKTQKGAAVGWRTVVSIPDEPGEPLVVSGTLYEPDGKTPVAGTDLYFYHTDVGGLYNHGDNDSDRPRLWGRLRTDPQGRFEFRTIKPGPYPGRRNPAHIHFEIDWPGHPVQTPELVFEGDPFLTDEIRQNPHFVVRPLVKGEGGALLCKLDLTLGPY